MTLRRRAYVGEDCFSESKEALLIQTPWEFDAEGEGDFMYKYGKYGRLSHKIPVEAWHVNNLSGKVFKVKVLKLRGAGADYYDKGSEYADLEGGKTASSMYLFSIKGYRKPEQYRIKDQYGIVTRWFAFLRGKNPKPLDVEQ